jgi:hypothetical protein
MEPLFLLAVTIDFTEFFIIEKNSTALSFYRLSKMPERYYPAPPAILKKEVILNLIIIKFVESY